MSDTDWYSEPHACFKDDIIAALRAGRDAAVANAATLSTYGKSRRDEIAALTAENERLRADLAEAWEVRSRTLTVVEAAAVGKRSDGTYNRGREALEQMAKAALSHQGEPTEDAPALMCFCNQGGTVKGTTEHPRPAHKHQPQEPTDA